MSSKQELDNQVGDTQVIKSIAEEIGSYQVVDLPRPHASQRDFLLSKTIFPSFWGGKGCGKSTVLVHRAILLITENNVFGDMAGNRIFLGRSEWEAFKLTTMLELFTYLPEEWIKEYVKQDKIVRLKNKSEILLGHFSMENMHKIKSLNLGAALFDQMEEMDLAMWEEFSLNRIRMTRKLNGEPLGYQTCGGVGNAPGPAHWCYQWEANRIAKEQGSGKWDGDYFCVNTTTLENAQNLPPGYVERAERNFTPKKFRINFLGSWEALEGQVFSEFDYKRHVVEDQVPHPDWDDACATDYGRTAGHAWMTMMITPERKLVVYNEAYVEDEIIETHVRLIIQRIRQDALAISEKWGRDDPMEGVPDLWWADPAMRRKADLNSKHEESPITLMGLYEEALALEGVDVSMMAANSEIDAGIDRVNYCFKHDLLTICRKCTNAIGQIGSYVYDPKTGKPKGRQKDHMCDVLRYLISMVYDLVVLPEKEREAPTVVEEIIRRMKWAQIGMREEEVLV